VDEMSMLLDRFADLQTVAVERPPMAALEAEARRRSMLRSLTSLSLVLVLVVGLVVGLASAGMASEHAPTRQMSTVALASAR
jgi:hypothetical protein